MRHVETEMMSLALDGLLTPTEERAFQQQVNQRTEALMRRLDRVVSAVTRRRPGELDPSVAADVSVRSVAHEAAWTGRGPEAWARTVVKLTVPVGPSTAVVKPLS